eukprot:scaffold565_cov379-Pinguiococcus_pyrenoidosus.AAC.21
MQPIAQRESWWRQCLMPQLDITAVWSGEDAGAVPEKDSGRLSVIKLTDLDPRGLGAAHVLSSASLISGSDFIVTCRPSLAVFLRRNREKKSPGLSPRNAVTGICHVFQYAPFGTFQF